MTQRDQVDRVLTSPMSYVANVLTVDRIVELSGVPLGRVHKLLDAMVADYPSEGQGRIVRIVLEHGMPSIVREHLNMTAEEYERWQKLRGAKA